MRLQYALFLSIVFSSSTIAESEIKILSVGDGFTIGGKPAVSISFGRSDSDYCTVTFAPSQFKLVSKPKNPDFYAVAYFQKEPSNYINGDCNINNKHYVISNKHQTHAILGLHNIDTQSKTASVSVDVQAVALPKKSYKKPEYWKVKYKFTIQDSYFSTIWDKR